MSRAKDDAQKHQQRFQLLYVFVCFFCGSAAGVYGYDTGTSILSDGRPIEDWAHVLILAGILVPLVETPYFVTTVVFVYFALGFACGAVLVGIHAFVRAIRNFRALSRGLETPINEDSFR